MYRSTATKTIRGEIHTIGQTLAEALEEKGKREGKLEGSLETKQDDLLMLLRRKFGKDVTAAIAANIRRTKRSSDAG